MIVAFGVIHCQYMSWITLNAPVSREIRLPDEVWRNTNVKTGGNCSKIINLADQLNKTELVTRSNKFWITVIKLQRSPYHSYSSIMGWSFSKLTNMITVLLPRNLEKRGKALVEKAISSGSNLGELQLTEMNFLLIHFESYPLYLKCDCH